MVKASLRRFDVQARWSLWLSLASAVTCLGTVLLLARNWHSDIQQIMFGSSLYQPLVFGFTGLTMLLSAFGLALGFSSAGQRRNELQRRSWVGFFLGSGVLALAVILLAVFWLLKLQTHSG